MNIFENITKENFIRLYFKYRKTTDELTTIERRICELSKYVKFEIEYEKEIKNQRTNILSIIDIPNYDTEIQLFNSFDVFREYCGKEYIILFNLNKYNKCKGIKKFWGYQPRYIEINGYDPCFSNMTEFKNYIKFQNSKKIESETYKKISEKQINSFKESFIDVLQTKLDFFDFNYNVKITFSLHFIGINKVLKKHLLKNNFLDNIRLDVQIVDNRIINEIELVEILKYKNEFYDCIIETGSYFGYKVYGDRPFYFKKIIPTI